MPRVQATVSCRIISKSGIHILPMAAGQTRDIDASLLAVALAAGCMIVPEEGAPTLAAAPPGLRPAEAEVDPATLLAPVVDAIKLLFQTGDTRCLTVNGDPKDKAIEELERRVREGFL